ncbi:hypothetical protein FACS1894110_07350 [Spirochaetia bacterium]|nr:hypothetical protein FACS1894110_07350 [Spirochaetia bacterium]
MKNNRLGSNGTGKNAFMLGVLAAALVLGMALAGCKTEEETSSVPVELIGVWHTISATGPFTFEITSGGIRDASSGILYGISVEGDTIYVDYGRGVRTNFLSEYVVSGNTLTGKYIDGISWTFYK